MLLSLAVAAHYYYLRFNSSQLEDFNKMAIVLALVILGWLVAIAIGAQDGFGNEPKTVPVQASATDSAKSSSSNYKDPLSVA